MRFDYPGPNFIHSEIRLYSNSTCNTLLGIMQYVARLDTTDFKHDNC